MITKYYEQPYAYEFDILSETDRFFKRQTFKAYSRKVCNTNNPISFFLFFFSVLGIKLRPSQIRGKHGTTKLHL